VARRQLIKNSFLAALIILLAAIVTSLTALRLSGDKLLTVQTASMVPTFRPGDALIVKPVPTSSLVPGQIISYHAPRDPNILISHRLIKIDPITGWLTTAGDARHSADPAFPPQLVAGRAVLLLPRLGTLLKMLRSPIGLSLLIYLPAGTTLLAEARRLDSIYAAPFYSARL
jgi:signal peptidase I